jgi:putative Ca2+/H+ antiporter (TMEM165/GDT1 family)
VKYFFGWMFILIGLLHGIHVLTIEPGSITSLAGSGLLGKFVVLAFDAAFVALGIYELRRKKLSKLEKNKSKIKQNTPK